MDTRKIAAARKATLRRLVDKHGETSLAKRLGYTSGPSYISQMIAGKRPITEKTARKVEETMGMTPGAMDAPAGEPLPFSEADTGVLSHCIRVLGEELELAKINPTPVKFAELVSMIYSHCIKTSDIDRGFVISLVKLLK